MIKLLFMRWKQRKILEFVFEKNKLQNWHHHKKNSEPVDQGNQRFIWVLPLPFCCFLKGAWSRFELFIFPLFDLFCLEKVFFKNHKKISLGRVSCGDLSKMETLQIFVQRNKQLLLWFCLHIDSWIENTRLQTGLNVINTMYCLFEFTTNYPGIKKKNQSLNKTFFQII